jgi:hypothetical protein
VEQGGADTGARLPERAAGGRAAAPGRRAPQIDDRADGRIEGPLERGRQPARGAQDDGERGRAKRLIRSQRAATREGPPAG